MCHNVVMTSLMTGDSADNDALAAREYPCKYCPPRLSESPTTQKCRAVPLISNRVLGRNSWYRSSPPRCTVSGEENYH